VVVKRRPEYVARDLSIFKQVSRWTATQGQKPKLNRLEWAGGMVVAMKSL
jgi:hypothetical protein